MSADIWGARTRESRNEVIHYLVPLTIIFVRDLDRTEGNGHVLFARPKEAADADDERGCLAVVIDEHVHHLADLAVLRIIDVLLVPMGNGFAVARDARHHLSSRAAALLLGLRARACRNKRN